MDFVMLYRMVECLRRGEPMDQNVYEGAYWSSLLPLTAHSIAQGGVPVEFRISPAAAGRPRLRWGLFPEPGVFPEHHYI